MGPTITGRHHARHPKGVGASDFKACDLHVPTIFFIYKKIRTPLIQYNNCKTKNPMLENKKFPFILAKKKKVNPNVY
jgi:hypothetical protein